MSYILNGRTELLASQQKTLTWIRTQTSGIPRKIRAGYFIRNGPNGKAYVNFDDLAFTAPMAVNAMLGGSNAQPWLNRLWTSITGGDYGEITTYYRDAIRLQVLLTISGNWWAP